MFGCKIWVFVNGLFILSLMHTCMFVLFLYASFKKGRIKGTSVAGVSKGMMSAEFLKK